MSKKKIALITGVTGQDGHYMSTLLKEKDYKIFGFTRKTISCGESIPDEVDEILYGDLRDSKSVRDAILKSKPDELYNFGAQSFVPPSFQFPEDTFDVNTLGVLRILEVLKELPSSTVRLYQASSSEMFGNQKGILDERDLHKPVSPYGISKATSHALVNMYRKTYGIFACCGIAFNHESPLRGKEFVTQKIVHGLLDIKEGKAKKLYLGNVNVKRDWGHAKDSVRAMYLVLQNEFYPQGYIIATSKSHSIQDFLNLAMGYIWPGEDISSRSLIEIDPDLFRPADIETLIGNFSRINNELGWEPEITFPELVNSMVISAIEKRA